MTDVAGVRPTPGTAILAAGAMRVWAGFHARPAAGWGLVAAAGAPTFCTGLILVATWPLIGLWLLGALLMVDLIFQGWGLVMFGLAPRSRASRRSRLAATV